MKRFLLVIGMVIGDGGASGASPDIDSLKPYLMCVGHSSGISSVTYSPDGGRVISASLDGTVRLWDAGNSKPIQKLGGVHFGLCMAGPTPDGKSIIYSSVDYEATRRLNTIVTVIHVWDAKTLEKKREFTHEASGGTFIVSPDSRTLFTRSIYGPTRLLLWDLESGKQIKRLEGHKDTVYAWALSRDGKTLASGDKNGSIILWDVESGKQKASWEMHRGYPIVCLAFSPDGKTLAAKTNELPRQFNEFFFSQSTIILKFYDVSSGKETIGLPATARIGTYDEAVAYSPDGKLFAVGHLGRINVYATDTWKLNAILWGSGTLRTLAFSPDSKRIASSDGERNVLIWRLED